MTRPLFFLSDFGLTDTYVGVVKAVILGIAPGTPIVDLTHDIPAQDVRAGAFALLAAAPYLPADAVVLAVVDPGVGTSRPAIAADVAGRAFVGPDNGLLTWAIQRLLSPPPNSLLAASDSGVGGAPAVAAANGAGSNGAGGETLRTGPGLRAVRLDCPRYWLPTVSTTFHGRDLFGPIAAHLARGIALAELGTAVDAIQALPFPYPSREGDAGRGEVIHVDHFGTLVTNLTAAALPPEPVIHVAGHAIVGLSSHFQGSTDLVALIGSSGFLEIAAPNGSAAAILDVGIGAAVATRSST
ncbi:MAG: SAM-dependent chlorinase/fluorinase [Chloroflexi bacterium]|nr:SAM-dependent chlorinase/fluorinase [Chloroflexota bacterium]